MRIMKTIVAIGIVLSLFALPIFADAPSTQPAPDSDGFISLFNGKDLTGWEGLPGFWSVEDGVIDGTETKATSKQTFLVLSASKTNPEKFANFELRLTYRFAGPAGNSGVQIRSKMMIPESYRVGGYQVDSDTVRPYDGNLYDEGDQAGGRKNHGQSRLQNHMGCIQRAKKRAAGRGCGYAQEIREPAGAVECADHRRGWSPHYLKYQRPPDVRCD